MNKLINCLIDEISGWNWSSIPVEHAVFLGPVHHEIPQHSWEYTNGLKGDIEADKHEQVDHINIFITHLEFDSFMIFVMFYLSLVKFTIWIFLFLLILLFQQRMNLVKKWRGSNKTTTGAVKAMENDIMKVLSTKPLLSYIFCLTYLATITGIKIELIIWARIALTAKLAWKLVVV